LIDAVKYAIFLYIKDEKFMTLLINEEINKIGKEIADNSEYGFDISESGIYMIEIIASAKNWLQNWKHFFDDDDLTVKIDDIEFPKLNGKTGLLNGEAAWNGNNLKGLKKTNVFIVHLKSGQHKIEFIADRSPYLESIKISKMENENWVEYIPEDENKQAQDGNNRQWINFVFTELPVKNVQISAKAEKREKDRDDIKLIIDGAIQENPDSEYFKNWYWCGSLDDGEEKTYEKEINLTKGLHYIELWADRMPTLNEVKIILAKNEEQKEEEQITAKVVWEIAKFRKEPKIDEYNILGELKQGDKLAVIEKAIEGERPTNKKDEFLTSNRWHRVKWNNKEGYIFSMALEIEGENQEAIQEFIIKKAKELQEDECLMLAIAKRESKFFPYSISGMEAKGLFQLVQDAMLHVNEEFKKDFSNAFDIYQNIEAGILYWKIVQEKYKNCDDFLSRCLAAWNRGLNRVSNTKPFILAEQPVETQQFIKDVNIFRKEYKDNIKNQGKILLYLLFLSVGIILIASFLFLYNFKTKRIEIPACYSEFSILDEKIIDIDGDRNLEKIAILSTVPTEYTFGITKIILIQKNGSFIELPDEGLELQWWEIGDFNKNGKKDVAVLYGYTGSAGFGDFYLYEWNRDNFITLFSREDIGNKVAFEDVDHDGIEEILYEFYPRKWSKKQLDVYKWDNEKLVYNIL